MSKKFEASWGIDDGCVTETSRRVTIFRAAWLEPEMTDQELSDLFYGTIQSDFEQKVSWFSEDRDRFLDWAKGVIAERKAKGDD